MISVIIPTLNEEFFLPRILASLKEQTYKDFEIVVADSNSKDKTVTIAEEHGCRVVIGKTITNPAMARNLGATIAQGEQLLFLDADVVLPPTFIEEFIAVFLKKKLDGAIPFCKPINETVKNSLVSSSYNSFFWLSQFVRAWGGGWCILVTKKMFEEIGGFDEEIVLGEDSELLLQIARRGKYQCLHAPVIHVSFRRFEHEGYAKVLLQQATTGLYQLVAKGIIDSENSVIKYRYGHYKQEPKKKDKKSPTSVHWMKKQLKLFQVLDEKIKSTSSEKDTTTHEASEGNLLTFFRNAIRFLDDKVNDKKQS